MNPPTSKEVYRAILEGLCSRSRLAAVLVGPGGLIQWSSSFARSEFPGAFDEATLFAERLDRVTCLEYTRADAGSLEPVTSLRRSHSGGYYRHFSLPIEESGSHATLHCLLDVSQDKRREDDYLQNMQQLKNMKEIVDILYESLSTPEVVYLCLIAVTAQMGFGFNRAFFLQVSHGGRMRGRIGIGPSNHEEAHAIWSRLSSLNFSSLREVYHDFTCSGGVPDPRTQEIATQLEFELKRFGWGSETIVSQPGILGVLTRGKPARLNASDPGTEVDRILFSQLATDVVAVVPLLVRGELAGVIIADNLITRKPITEADLNVLKTFAGYAGVALERSHLYDELRESVAKLQAANDTLKTSQQKLLQVEKLSAIGELAAYVSHEIRNPLVAIGGLARSLISDQHDPDTAETLQIIVAEVTRLERFLRETLDFVKPKVVGKVAMDLSQIVRQCLATFRNEMFENSIELDSRIPQEPVACLTDPELLRHALSNLIKNAIEAMKGGGKLLVEVQKS